MLGNSCWLPRFFRYPVLLFSENKRHRAFICRCHFVPTVNCAQVIWLRPSSGRTKMFCFYLKPESSSENQAGVRTLWRAQESCHSWLVLSNGQGVTGIDRPQQGLTFGDSIKLWLEATLESHEQTSSWMKNLWTVNPTLLIPSLILLSPSKSASLCKLL